MHPSHLDRRLPAPLALLALGLAAASAGAQLVTAGNHRIFQAAVGGLEEAGDHFGATLAAGDFDRDGYWDLAIGLPEEDVGAALDAGAVVVVYGEPDGPGQGARTPLWLHQDVASVQDVAQEGDRFGAALAVGDFNGDGFDDLAVGVPGEDVPIDESSWWAAAGVVHVFPGAPGGLVAAADTYFTGDSFDPATYSPNSFEDLGAALAACDWSGDGRDDLLVGVPRHDRISGEDTGLVLMIPGSASGVETDFTLYYAPAGAEGGDRFGTAIACGDINGPGADDILIGAPRAELLGGGTDSGGAWILYAGGSSIQFSGGEAGNRLGNAVAVGSVAGNGRDQVLLGLPGALLGAQDEAGVVSPWDMVDGFFTDVRQGGDFAETASPFDHFGDALAVGDFDRDGFDDLVVGVPGENLNDGLPSQKLDAGVVHVVPGSPAGPSGAADQLWSWDAPIFFGTLANDHFGAALAVGDFDRNGVDDLAIGVPNAAWNEADTGIVQILYGWPPGWIFGDGFETADTRKWGP